MMKHAIYFILKTLHSYRYLNFYLDFIGHVGKRLDKKAKNDFKIYNVINRKTNNYNLHIAQYLKK